VTEPNGQEPPRTLVVPGRPAAPGDGDADEAFEGLISQADIGSASRSCLAIIIVLLVIALLLCVFLVGALVM
jgi:hypothetical protein